MMGKEYYSRRTGKLKDTPALDFELFKKLTLVTYNKLDVDGFFQKYFGYYCVDVGDMSGVLGDDIDSAMFISLRKQGLWPVRTKIESYSEDDLFDVIEYLHDHCSKPISGRYHDWSNCGWHYDTFDDVKGQRMFRERFNPLLKDFKEGYELSDKGEILTLPEQGMVSLLEAEIPSSDIDNISKRVENAILKFRRHRSTIDERKEAIRELADVLEFLRPQVKQALESQDESDLFNIANNFGIRHHNTKQKVNYDKSIWYSWLFYYYLSTIHATLRLIAKQQQTKVVSPGA